MSGKMAYGALADIAIFLFIFFSLYFLIFWMEHLDRIKKREQDQARERFDMESREQYEQHEQSIIKMVKEMQSKGLSHEQIVAAYEANLPDGVRLSPQQGNADLSKPSSFSLIDQALPPKNKCEECGKEGFWGSVCGDCMATIYEDD